MTSSTLTMLGTGNAAATKCYNTCFVITTPDTRLLVDAGGGNGVLSQLDKAGIPLSQIHHFFITHVHTDHILGGVWIVRMVIQAVKRGTYDGHLHIYGHDKSLRVLRDICCMTLPQSLLRRMDEVVIFDEVKDGDHRQIGDLLLTFFDLRSTKEKQFGLRAILPSGRSLVCLGDEPYNEENVSYVVGADWLLCEAFCLYCDRERFKPYEKHHSTAKDVGRIAAELKPGHVVIYHTEDTDLAHRKEQYTREAHEEFEGDVRVPDDLEVIRL